MMLPYNLRRLTGKNLQYATANVEDEAHLDVGCRQRDVRAFNPTSSSCNCDTPIASLYRWFEWEKQWHYEQMINRFIHSFGFLTLRVMGGAARVASLLSMKRLRSTLQSGDVLAMVLHQLFLVAIHYNLHAWSSFYPWQPCGDWSTWPNEIWWSGACFDIFK